MGQSIIWSSHQGSTMQILQAQSCRKTNFFSYSSVPILCAILKKLQHTSKHLAHKLRVHTIHIYPGCKKRPQQIGILQNLTIFWSNFTSDSCKKAILFIQ